MMKEALFEEFFSGEETLETLASKKQKISGTRYIGAHW